MKKLLQFVALVLALCVSVPPVLAEGACVPGRCDGRRMMDCCQGMGGMQMAAGARPMGRSEAGPIEAGSIEAGPMAVGPKRCDQNSCRAAAAMPAVLGTSASGAAGTGASVERAPWPTPRTWAAAKRPPGVRAGSPTARYILFRDFRI